MNGKRIGKITEFNITYQKEKIKLVLHKDMKTGLIIRDDDMQLIDEVEYKHILSSKIICLV